MSEIVEILKTAGLAAGIGGLAIGLALVIFRDVIRKNIFPRMNQGYAFTILMAIVVFTWIISMFGIYVYWSNEKQPQSISYDMQFKLDHDRMLCSKDDVISPKFSESKPLAMVGVGDCRFDSAGHSDGYTVIAEPYGINFVNDDDDIKIIEVKKDQGAYYHCSAIGFSNIGKNFGSTLSSVFFDNSLDLKFKRVCTFYGALYSATKVSYKNKYGVDQTRFFEWSYKPNVVPNPSLLKETDENVYTRYSKIGDDNRRLKYDLKSDEFDKNDLLDAFNLAISRIPMGR